MIKKFAGIALITISLGLPSEVKTDGGGRHSVSITLFKLGIGVVGAAVTCYFINDAMREFRDPSRLIRLSADPEDLRTDPLIKSWMLPAVYALCVGIPTCRWFHDSFFKSK